MLKLQRVCVPLSLDCNLHCKYCYRDKEKLEKIPEFTEDMKKYLGQLSSDWCEAVVASGGEPLLHWDKVKELFSYVPEKVHKKVMSNSLLLTQEIVDYLNQNNIELHTSHDGAMTQFLRGYDILADNNIHNLLKQVKLLRVYCVTTKYNNDVWECYFDTVKRLGRLDFQYDSFAMYDTSSQHDLIDGFDYEKWFKTYTEVRCMPRLYKFLLPWYNGRSLSNQTKINCRPCGLNVLPDGTVCGMIRVCSVYGSIHTKSYEDCYNKLVSLGETDYCIKTNCKFKDTCKYPPQCTSEHICKCRKMIMERWNPEFIQQVSKYVKENFEEIVKKYV